MSDCTCEYDKALEAYVHVCGFHLPALRRDADGWALAGRRVAPSADIEVDGLEQRLVPLATIDRATRSYASGLDAERAVKRATLAASSENPEPTNRAERRRRGQRGTYMASLDRLTLRKR